MSRFHPERGAVGAEINMNLVAGAILLSYRERILSDPVAAECQRAVVDKGAACCCKRESFRAMISARNSSEECSGAAIPVEPAPPRVSTSLSRECLRESWVFHGLQKVSGKNTAHKENEE